MSTHLLGMISKQIYFCYKYSWPILLHTSLLNHRFDREKSGYTSPREEGGMR